MRILRVMEAIVAIVPVKLKFWYPMLDPGKVSFDGLDLKIGQIQYYRKKRMNLEPLTNIFKLFDKVLAKKKKKTLR